MRRDDAATRSLPKDTMARSQTLDERDSRTRAVDGAIRVHHGGRRIGRRARQHLALPGSRVRIGRRRVPDPVSRGAPDGGHSDPLPRLRDRPSLPRLCAARAASAGRAPRRRSGGSRSSSRRSSRSTTRVFSRGRRATSCSRSASSGAMTRPRSSPASTCRSPTAPQIPITFDFVPGVLIPLVLMQVVTLVILGAGVVKGVQRANVIIIPLLVVAFIALVIRALFLPGALDGLDAFFTPDFAALADPGVWIAAYTEIFFSLSIAFGIMITYASYRRRRSNMTGAGLVVAFGNSSFEILAGIGVFSTIRYTRPPAGHRCERGRGPERPDPRVRDVPRDRRRDAGRRVLGRPVLRRADARRAHVAHLDPRGRHRRDPRQVRPYAQGRRTAESACSP